MFSVKASMPVKLLHALVFMFLFTSVTLPTHNLFEQITEEPLQNQPFCYCDFCNEICLEQTIQSYKATKKNCCAKTISRTKKRPRRTIIIYMAADNDLRVFAARNIQQMAAVGSNENINILVHLDIRISGNKKITRRYLIEKDKVLHIDPYDIMTQQMDSGNPATLISCCEWAIKSYPADEYDLILWNHGTGILEPPHGKIINPMDLFVFNPTTHLLELDRSIGFLDALNRRSNNLRGICWDDTTGNYLSNKKLDLALQTIRHKYLDGKKFGIIGFDACLMAMTEITSFIKKHAQIMASSQEVELGMGWKYDEVLYPFTNEALDTFTFARHIVNAYEKTYQSITYDYTFSAINLNGIDELEKNINDISAMLIQSLSNQKTAYARIIKESRNKHLCTHFDEPSYIDLHHFYTNLAKNIQHNTPSSHQDKHFKEALLIKINEGIALIEKLVIANTTGRNLKNARGISIYFPERGIHSSYKEAFFLENNHWGAFLSHYLFG